MPGNDKLKIFKGGNNKKVKECQNLKPLEVSLVENVKRLPKVNNGRQEGTKPEKEKKYEKENIAILWEKIKGQKQKTQKTKIDKSLPTNSQTKQTQATTPK